MESAAPESVYCLKCRSTQKAVPGSMKLEKSQFKSKNGKDMVRNSWIGQCEKCSKSVRRFAKTEKAPAAPAAPAPEAPVPMSN